MTDRNFAPSGPWQEAPKPPSYTPSPVQLLRDRIGLVSDAQFAAMMEVSEFTTQVWRVNGTGPMFVKLGRSVFYRLKDIEEWMARNLHSSTETTGPITSRDMVKEELDAMFAPTEGQNAEAA